MKKKFFVIGTVLAMLVIMVFPCYGEPLKDENECYKACYQKNNGQLRLLTGHKDECRQNAEVSFALCPGGQVPEVPRICAASISAYCIEPYIPCSDHPPFISSCVSEVSRTQPGYYDITFSKEFQSPICVIYVYPLDADPMVVIWANYSEIPSSTGISGIKVKTYTYAYDGGPGGLDVDFNFICTEP